MVDNRKENIWTLYIHIVPKSITKYTHDKYYVGITKQSIKNRWNNGNGYRNQIFYKAIKKYGWNNIEHYVIASYLTENEAKDFEKILINKLKCNTRKYGYNRTNGGDGILGFAMSTETKNKISKSHMGIKNPFYGKTHTKEARLKMSEKRKNISRIGKKVYQFDINGNYITTYKSIREAEKVFSIFNSQLGRHIKSHTPFLNYLWGFESDVFIINNIPKLNYEYKGRFYSYAKRVYKFNMNGDYITSYSSIKEAEIELGTRYTLGRNIKQHKEFFGYLWGFDEDVIIINNTFKLNYIYKKKLPKNFKSVYMFNINGDFIKKYNCAIEASKDTNINNKYITQSARLWNTSCGYYWRYEDGIGFDKNNQPILLNKGGGNYG